MGLNALLGRRIILIIFEITLIPSIVCSLLIFYHFARSRELRQRLNNHAILILLLINFIQVSNQRLI